MSSPPESPPAPDAPQSAEPSRWWWPLVPGAAVGIAIRLIFSGQAGGPYTAMMSSFTLLVPILVGQVTVLIAERTARRSWGYYFRAAASANALFVFGTLAVTVEGLVCCILAVPLFAVLGGLGGLLTGAIVRWAPILRRPLFGFAILPLTLGGLEQNVPLPNTIIAVEQSRSIAAPPAEVWKHLLSAQAIRPDEIGAAWMYRIGVPLPLSAAGEERDGELVRHISMGKGIHFDQVSNDWEFDHRVLWTYRFTPDSFPPHALDDHVRIGGQYFDVIDTDYTIDRTSGGSLLHVVMRYR